MSAGPRPESRRADGRSGAFVVLGLLVAIVAVALAGGRGGDRVEEGVSSPSPLPAGFPPGVPLIADPELKLMGVEPQATHNPLCTESRTATMTASFAQRVEDGVEVDLARWEATPMGGRAGYASFWSKCFHDGAPVRIRSDAGGEVVAIYDPTTGLGLP